MAKSRIKLPKRLAGVKIPKVVRKGPINDFLNSTGGQLLLAQAALAAITLFTAKQATGQSASEVLAHPVDSLKKTGKKAAARAGQAQDELARSSARLRFAFEEGVRAFREALAEPVPSVADGAPLAANEDEGGKKKNWSQPETTPH
jgi:hypothetical protein